MKTKEDKMIKMTVAKLEKWLNNPTKNIEGEPELTLKNGVKVIIEKNFGKDNGFELSRVHGLTVSKIKKCMTLEEIARIIIIINANPANEKVAVAEETDFLPDDFEKVTIFYSDGSKDSGIYRM